MLRKEPHIALIPRRAGNLLRHAEIGGPPAIAGIVHETTLVGIDGAKDEGDGAARCEATLRIIGQWMSPIRAHCTAGIADRLARQFLNGTEAPNRVGEGLNG